MTYLKVGDGVWVNGEIKIDYAVLPFGQADLFGRLAWIGRQGPLIDATQECAENAAKIARDPIEPDVCGHEWEPTLRDLVQSDTWRRKMEALPPPKLQPPFTVTKVSGPGNVQIKSLRKSIADMEEMQRNESVGPAIVKAFESATNLVNRVAGEQREGKR